ncbi:hypothetical protein [Lacticaseibacillus hulanensis]|uniref:hypothetical protein n=1 Tax=Lacticaseibacillus hulanensis TaxID=2493111 RepID=UPI000FDA1928|nr:hypothetical protein [Lacticaseibacillus hulanensis]
MAWGFMAVALGCFGSALVEIILRRHLKMTVIGRHRLLVMAIIMLIIGLTALLTGRLDRYYGNQLRAIENARISQATTSATDMMGDVFTNNMNHFANNIISLSTQTRELEKLQAKAAKANTGHPVTVGAKQYTDATSAINATIAANTKLVNKIVQTTANLGDEFAIMSRNQTVNSAKQLRALNPRLMNAQALAKLMLNYGGNWATHARLFEQYSCAMFY